MIEWSVRRGCRDRLPSHHRLCLRRRPGGRAGRRPPAFPENHVDKILIDAGEDTLDELQDAVYAGSIGRILIPSLAILGPDLMAQESILASWVEKSISVFCRDEPDLGADDPERRRIRGVLGEIEEYGKIPWVP